MPKLRVYRVWLTLQEYERLEGLRLRPADRKILRPILQRAELGGLAELHPDEDKEAIELEVNDDE